MNKFSIDLVGTEALQINFIQPYPRNIVTHIHTALELMGAKMESKYYHSYVDVYGWSYRYEQNTFTFADDWDGYNIYAQGNNVLIGIIAKALVESGLFEKKPD